LAVKITNLVMGKYLKKTKCGFRPEMCVCGQDAHPEAFCGCGRGCEHNFWCICTCQIMPHC